MKGNILLIVSRVMIAVQNVVTISMEEGVGNSMHWAKHMPTAPFFAK